MLLFSSVLFLSALFTENMADDDVIDLNLFHQHDYQLKFERAVVDRFNKSFVDCSITTFKYNRSLTALNITVTPKVDLGYNLRTIVQVYKFMSNEYRYFPIRFAANTCKAFDANIVGMGKYPGCPLLKGVHYHVHNWYPDPSILPPLIPDGEFKIELQTLLLTQELGVVNAYVTITRPIV